MISTFDYRRSLPEIEDRLLEATRRVLRSGTLVLGPETELLEHELAELLGVAHCVTVSSGTTAVHLALWALGIGPGDEVVTVANTCVPTVAAIRLTGATPVLADVCDSDLTIDPGSLRCRLSAQTRCIVPVHLWGLAARIDEILAIADEWGVPVVEDCAQAHGTLLHGRHAGTMARAGCFSFYPTKNIGSFGEGGAIVTNDGELAERLRRMRTYGYNDQGEAEQEGLNARINELQAAFVRIKLQVYDDWLARRLAVAEIYDRELAGVLRPMPIPHSRCSYHQYVLRVAHRDRLRRDLLQRGIATGVHYPVPIHHMPAYAALCAGVELPVSEQACREIVSLPINEAMTAPEARQVAAAVTDLVGIG